MSARLIKFMLMGTEEIMVDLHILKLCPFFLHYGRSVQIIDLCIRHCQQKRRMGGYDEPAAKIAGGIADVFLQLKFDRQAIFRFVDQMQCVFCDPFSIMPYGGFAVGEYTGGMQIGAGLQISYVCQDTSGLCGRISDFARQQWIEESLFLAMLSTLDVSKRQMEKDMSSLSAGQKKKFFWRRVFVSLRICISGMSR